MNIYSKINSELKRVQSYVYDYPDHEIVAMPVPEKPHLVRLLNDYECEYYDAESVYYTLRTQNNHDIEIGQIWTLIEDSKVYQ